MVHPFTDKDAIVLTDFDNSTGNPMFDNTLRTGLAIDLGQSPYLNVLSDLSISHTLKLMGRSPGDRITQDVGREICLRTSSKALLTGAITPLGSHYALQLKATDCQTGQVLAAVEAEAEGREKLLQTLSQAATALRTKLGESHLSVQKYDRPLVEATTSSLEALQALSDGGKVWTLKGEAAAIPFFERAIELDPDFAWAHLSLGFCHLNLGQTSQSIRNMRRAYELREHLSEPEQYFVSAWYYTNVSGEVPKAIQELQLLAQEYPQDDSVHLALGNNYEILGQWENAAAEQRAQIQTDPDDVLGYDSLIEDYTNLNRLDKAHETLDQALARMPDNPYLHRWVYSLAFLKNDTVVMQQQLQWAKGKPEVESTSLFQEANTHAYYGRVGKWRDTATSAVAVETRDGAAETAAAFEAEAAAVEAALGNTVQARQAALKALTLSSGRDVRKIAALAMAQAGNSEGAQQQLAALNKEFPLDTLVQNYWLPTVRAQIEVNHGQAQRALAFLEPARPYELTSVGIPMYAVWIRAQAYLASGDGTAAAAEFQKILDHRGLIGADVTGALAHLYLGRAHALEARSLRGTPAENAKGLARAAYQDFLNLWKDADPDIPIFRQAKAEYARLQ
jgi:tetratricopeptide (TPR) repeat protein